MSRIDIPLYYYPYVARERISVEGCKSKALPDLLYIFMGKRGKLERFLAGVDVTKMIDGFLIGTELSPEPKSALRGLKLILLGTDFDGFYVQTSMGERFPMIMKMGRVSPLGYAPREVCGKEEVRAVHLAAVEHEGFHLWDWSRLSTGGGPIMGLLELRGVTAQLIKLRRSGLITAELLERFQAEQNKYLKILGGDGNSMALIEQIYVGSIRALLKELPLLKRVTVSRAIEKWFSGC